MEEMSLQEMSLQEMSLQETGRQEKSREYRKQFRDGRPYYSLSSWLKQMYGSRVYRLALDGGMSCPNRDGTAGRGGCIFCSAGGSGEFAAAERKGVSAGVSVREQIEAAKRLVSKKIPPGGPYIAYFQSYTNTYAPVEYLRERFTEAIRHPEIAVLSVATRPDCLEPDKIRLLSELNRIKPVWVELGLQTIHQKTADLIRRGYPLSCFDDALERLQQAGLTVVVHLILGLPGETKEQMLQSVDAVAKRGQAVSGIKLQLLHVLKGTDLAVMYEKEPFPLFSLEEYVDFVITCVEHLPPSMVIHRLTGDGPRRLLIAPEWSCDKKRVLNTIARRFRQRGTWQGRLYRE